MWIWLMNRSPMWNCYSVKKNNFFVFSYSEMKRVIFIFLVLIAASCSKKPTICFTPNKTTAFTADTISFTNCSEKGRYYEWTFGDGYSDFENENSQHAYQNPGTYTVQLSARSKSSYSIKSYSTSQTITIVESVFGCTDQNATNYNPLANRDDGTCTFNGKKTFWTATSTYTSIRVSINGVYAGTVYYNSTTTPDCENGTGTLKITRPSGLYTYDTVYYDSLGNVLKTGAGAINIIGGACELLKLN